MKETYDNVSELLADAAAEAREAFQGMREGGWAKDDVLANDQKHFAVILGQLRAHRHKFDDDERIDELLEELASWAEELEEDSDYEDW